MPNFLSKQEDLIVDGSEGDSVITHEIRKNSRGRESIICVGSFGGATVELQTELRFSDGQTSGVVNLPEESTYTAPFSAVASIGYNSNLHVRISGITSTTRIYMQCNAVDL